MSGWDPAQYLRFEGPRARPALDLVAALGDVEPASIVDLGCGAGNVTRMLERRWPGARITGIDSAAAMLEEARHRAPGIAFRQADIAGWSAGEPPDLLFSNAALHWLPDHGRLLPRLVRQIATGGVLAVQMPKNHDAPSHRLAFELAESQEWRHRLGGRLAARPVADAADYHRLLAPLAASVDVWETSYLHVLEGEDPVLNWIRSTTLRPVLDILDEEGGRRFMESLRHRLGAAYPPEADGTVLYPFRRMFVVARHIR